MSKNNGGTSNLFMIIAAIIFPPLAVGIKRGLSGSLVINIILTLLGFIPGLIHALFVVL
jgi:uncharacterized membrane protein YqaE (UPF0057 family)